MNLTTIVIIVTDISFLLGLIIPVVVAIRKISNGTRCQLRSQMLEIYYHNCEKGIIRQYEYENFIMLYEAYKALKGNSFVDKIYKEVQTWKIIT